MGTSAGAAGVSSGGSGIAGASPAGGRGGSTSSAGSAGSAAGSAGSAAGAAGSLAGGASGKLLFSDDFEDGNASGWVTSGGSWSVVSDGTKVYAQTATATGSTVLLSASGSSAWTDQVLEARLKVTSFPGQSTSYYAGIYARYDGTHYYALLLRSDGKLVIRKDKTSLGNAVDAALSVGTWYTLRFDVIGTSLKAYLNGVLQSSVVDGTLSAGNVAVSTVNASAVFDDIRVTAP